MRRTRRQLLALLLLACGGFATLATEEAPPGVSQESGDHLSFNGGQRTEVRHVSIKVVSGDANVSDVAAFVPIETGGVNGRLPVFVTVVRDRDGATVLDNHDLNNQADDSSNDNDAGGFVAIDACSRRQTCTETFTFTFVRVLDDPRPSLAFDWSVSANAQYTELETGTSPPPGASLSVTITR